MPSTFDASKLMNAAFQVELSVNNNNNEMRFCLLINIYAGGVWFDYRERQREIRTTTRSSNTLFFSSIVFSFDRNWNWKSNLADEWVDDGARRSAAAIGRNSRRLPHFKVLPAFGYLFVVVVVLKLVFFIFYFSDVSPLRPSNRARIRQPQQQQTQQQQTQQHQLHNQALDDRGTLPTTTTTTTTKVVSTSPILSSSSSSSTTTSTSIVNNTLPELLETDPIRFNANNNVNNDNLDDDDSEDFQPQRLFFVN